MQDESDRIRPVLRRRKRIFEAAKALFSERGFEAVGIREIADEAGVSKSLINRHFGTKDGLRQVVDLEVMEEFERLLRVVLAPDTQADDLDVAAANRAQRLNVHMAELMPLLRYLRHSLLESSEAGHAMFRAYVSAAARSLGAKDFNGDAEGGEQRLWLLLSVMFLQLGPIFLESHISALTGHSPFSVNSVQSRSITYSLIEAKLREIVEELE